MARKENILEAGIKKLAFNAGKNFAKLKKIVKKPIEKDAGGNNKPGAVADKVFGAGAQTVAEAFNLSGALSLWLAECFVNAFDVTFVNNWILRYMKKRNAEKDKKHPDATAYAIWYLMLVMMLGGAAGIKNKDKIADNVKGKIENVKYAKKLKTHNINTIKIDPNLPKDQWLAQIDNIWEYIYMETVLSEGFVNEAYADVGDTGGYMTIGSGYMIGKTKPSGNKDRAIIKERKNFFEKVLGKPYTNGVSVSYEENERLVRAFYETYVWPSMKNSFSTPMDAHLFIELGIGMYNRGQGIYKDKQDGQDIRQSVNDDESLNDIVNRFDDLCKAGNAGLRPKYGVAAHRVLGNISDRDILDSYANSVYQMSSKKLWKDGSLLVYDDVAKDLKNVRTANIQKNGRTYEQKRLREYLSPSAVAVIEKGGLFDNDFVFDNKTPSIKQETSAEKLNELGEKLYDDGDYKGAIKKFELAIRENPNLYIVYSNMAISYYQLGEYNKGLKVIDNFIASSNFNSAPKEVKGYTYFNGALCYEKLGDTETRKSKKIAYYNKAKEYAAKGEAVANTQYKSLNSRIDNKIKEAGSKSKTVAFNNATKQLQEKIINAQFNLDKNSESRA